VELQVGAESASQSAGKNGRVGFDDEIDVDEALAAEEDVAHGAAH
jgi:hypothetical protein